jgi:hypothetical protein
MPSRAFSLTKRGTILSELMKTEPGAWLNFGVFSARKE